jgi:hypothetical protein
MITIEGPYEHRIYNSDQKVEAVKASLEQSQLPRLLSNELVSAHANSDSSIVLGFSNGDKLAILLSDGPYEAYSIRIRGRELIV